MSVITESCCFIESEEFTLLEVVRKHWYEIVGFLTQALSAESEEQQKEMESDLIFLHEHLNSIVEVLLMSKEKLLQTVTANTRNNKCRDNNADYCEQDKSSLNTSLYSKRYSLLNGSFIDKTRLPLCYTYLFITDESVNEDVHNENSQSYSIVNSALEKSLNVLEETPLDYENNKTTNCKVHMSFPSPIGATFLLTLCMFAKSNQPDGTRNVIVHFLSRLLSEADLIMCENTSSTYFSLVDDSNANNDAKNDCNNVCNQLVRYSNQKFISILMLTPASTIVPLLDVIRKIGYELQFTYHHQLVFTQEGEQHCEDDRLRERKWIRHSEMFTRHLANMHVEYVKLLCALAERIEQIPLLANYFISEHSIANNSISLHPLDHNTNYADSSTENYVTFELLDLLVPYLSYDHMSENGNDVREMYRFAFGAILSLARCSDREVKKFVSNADIRIRNSVLTSMRTTLLTLCKVPHNDESVQQMCYLIDAIRWWSCYELIVSHCPNKAHNNQMLNCFVQETLLPLLQSNNTHAYTAVCLITARLLHNLEEAQCCHVVEVIVRNVLHTLVREVDGKVVRNVNERMDTNSFLNKSEIIIDNISCTNSKNVERTKETIDTDHVDASEKFISFIEFYLLPHLTTNPSLTNDQYINSEAIGFQLDEWSATAATLILIKTIADITPTIFLQYLTNSKKSQNTDTNLTCLEQMLQNTTSLSVAVQETIEERQLPIECLHKERNEGKSCTHFEGIGECFPPIITTLIENTTTSTVFGVDRLKVDEEILREVLRKQELMFSFPTICESENRKQATPSSLCYSSTFPAVEKSTNESVQHSTKEETIEQKEMEPCKKSQHSRYYRKELRFDCNVALEAPLLTYLCRMIKEFIYLPHHIRLLLCGVIRSICLLPSDKLFYYLFNAEHGCFFRALTALRSIIEHALDEETCATLRKPENVEEECCNACATNVDCTSPSKEREHRALFSPVKAESPIILSQHKSTLHQTKFDNETDNNRGTSNSILHSASWLWSAFKSQEHTSSTSAKKKRTVLYKEMETKRSEAKQIEHLENTQREHNTISKQPKRKWRELWLEYVNWINTEITKTNSSNPYEGCIAIKKSVSEADCFTHNQHNKALSLYYSDLPELLKACVDVTLLAIDIHAITRFQDLSKLIQSL